MRKDRLTLLYPVAVEGKYDKARVSNVIDSPIIVLGGFSAFNDTETLKLIKTLGKNGVILLTDPDKAGTFIRGKLKTLLGDVELINVYAPPVKGTDSRRNHVCKDGILGVESTDEQIIYDLLLPYSKPKENKRVFLDSVRAYADGIAGKPNSAELRRRICDKLSLPRSLSSKMLTEHINGNLSEREYVSLLEQCRKEVEK